MFMSHLCLRAQRYSLLMMYAKNSNKTLNNLTFLTQNRADNGKKRERTLRFTLFCVN